MASFDATGLDPRLLRALAKKGYERPTPAQAETIPRVLEGKDVVARARTGSGKTMAYVLPALHKVLTSGAGAAGWQVLVLVPTRELCEQVRAPLTNSRRRHHACLLARGSSCPARRIRAPIIFACHSLIGSRYGSRLQVREEAQSVAQHCGDELRVTTLSGSGPPAAQRAAISTAGQVVVATPGRVAQVCGAS